MTKQAIHFGAGNIGRGFIGLLLHNAGYYIHFVDVVDEIVQELKIQSSYDVQVAGSILEITTVSNFTALDSKSEQQEITDTIATAEILTTAVGPNILSLIAENIAMGIEKRSSELKPLIVIACENIVGNSSLLKNEVEKYIDSQQILNKAVFLDCAVDRVVPIYEGSNILDVRVEEYFEWSVEQNSSLELIPKIEGMTLTENLKASIERKLFTLNTAHAMTAWLGYRKGYKTIGEAILDKEIFQTVFNAVNESGAALIEEHGLCKDAYEEYRDVVLERFKNPYIDDTVERVGRQPLRKLAAGDRILGPIEKAIKYNLKFDYLVFGFAAALHFDYDLDSEAKQLHKTILIDGVEETIKNILKDFKGKKTILIEKVIRCYNLI